MKTWFNSWKRKGLDVEAELRASRPKAPEQLVRSISMRVNGRPLYAGRRTRLGLVAVLGAACLAVLGATGGFSYAATSLESAVNATTGVAHFSGVLHFSSNGNSHKSAAGNQYNVAPHITKVVPTTAAGGHTVMTVSGTNIKANSVTVAGASVGSFSVNTPSSVKFTAPTQTHGATGPVVLTTDYGDDTSATQVTLVESPVIGASGLSQTNFEPGLSLTITGTGLTGATSVGFTGLIAGKTKTIVAKSPSVTSDTELTVTVPAGLPASGNVTVTNLAGTSAQSAQTFTFSSSAPTITSFTPKSGLVVVAGQDSTATSVDIIGTNFSSSDTVEFNGVNAATQTFDSSTEFHATAPAGATAGKISVVDTVGGAGISAASFTPVKNPTVTSVTPSAAPATGGGAPVGKVITIDGTNLQGVGTKVTFPNVVAEQTPTAHKGSTTQLDVKVPTGATSGSLTISNPAGSTTSAFVLIAAPGPVTFTDLDHTPKAIPGDTLQIDTTTANGFAGVTSVAIGKTVIQSGSFTSFTATRIKLSIPTGTASGAVTVTNSAGLKATATTTLTMTPGPTIKAYPATGVADGATSITVTGTGFNGADSGATTTVIFHTGATTTSAAATVNLAGTSLTVNPPSSTTSGTLTVHTDAGSLTGKAIFVPVKTPSISGGSPKVDHAGDFGGKAGTTMITLQGSSFNGLTTTDTKVTFPGVATAQVAKVTGSSSLTVKIPTGAHSGSLTVTNSAGSDTITGFKVITQAPAPTGPLTMTHGTTFTITGTGGFLSVSSIKIGKNVIATANFSITDDTHITVTLPANAKTGTNQIVSLTNAFGSGKLTGVTIN